MCSTPHPPGKNWVSGNIFITWEKRLHHSELPSWVHTVNYKPESGNTYVDLGQNILISLLGQLFNICPTFYNFVVCATEQMQNFLSFTTGQTILNIHLQHVYLQHFLLCLFIYGICSPPFCQQKTLNKNDKQQCNQNIILKEYCTNIQP